MSAVQQAPASGALCIDALLHGSYLLVVELCRGASVNDGPRLWSLCVKQVEAVRTALQQAELDAPSIDHISHAQCALLDETVLRLAQEASRAAWVNQTLQARFFNRHQAGEFLYQDMRSVLLDSAASPLVLTAFHRVLMLGFKGRYPDINDPQRQQLLAALAARVTPLGITQPVITQAGRRRKGAGMRWVQSPLLNLLAAALLLASVWWGLDRALGQSIAALVPGLV